MRAVNLQIFLKMFKPSHLRLHKYENSLKKYILQEI